MKKIVNICAVTIAALALAACGGAASNLVGDYDAGKDASLVGVTMPGEDEVCGMDSVDLFAGQTIDVGSLIIANDEENLYVSYELVDGWLLKETHVHVGCSLDDFPLTKNGNPKVGNFAYQMVFDPYMDTYALAIPLADIACFAECGDALIVGAHAAVVLLNDVGEEIQGETAWGDGPGFPGKNWFTYSEYETACCEEEPPEPEECAEPGDFRTQTQGGWGTVCNGNNPGCYRDANFGTVFPDGLILGGDPYELVLTSSLAVEAFLPQGGTPASLDADYMDPLETSAGVLGGQVTALALSVNFDMADPDFGASEVLLGDTIAQDGICAGMSVFEILEAGECFLSGAEGCDFNASEINSCVSSSNEAFVDGTTVTEYLCPPEDI